MKKILLLLLITPFLNKSIIAQVNLPLGLKAYYPFTGNANDVSGNNNNPVFNNATLTADRFGNANSAYRFNGTSSYMRIPNAPSINMANQMSIALWVKPMGFYAGTCHGNSIMMKGDADFLVGNYMLRFDDNAFTNGANCSGSPVNTTNQNYYGVNAVVPSPGYTPYIQQNQWSSVVYTTDGITSKLYVNCILKYSGSHGNNTFTNTYDLFFGRLNDATFPYWLNGDLDEVRIYDRALNQDEVNVLGGCVPLNPCDTWLKTPSFPSSVSVGDIDVVGNKVTVEAMFSGSSAISPSLMFGKLVSKHTDATNVNYSLMPITCEITTTSGYINTPPVCQPINDKLYHIAMVYDGAILKFYRNGFLLSSVPWTGNLVNNNLLTTIASGPNNPGSPYQQLGYMNEVRIWNVARTQAQLQTYMNSSLPNPTTQTGLLGYYTFDNLLNKQGNAAYNGTLSGGTTINSTNPNCTYVADSCGVIPTTTACKGIIDLHGNDCVRLPLSQEYYANTGFTWETWFNSNWYENNDNTSRLGQSLMMSEDPIVCEDIQLGFGWVNIPRNAIGFVVDGPGQCNERDNSPVFYRPPGGFAPNTWYHVAGVRNYATNQTQLYFNGQLVDTKSNTRQPFNRNILTRLGTYVVAGDSGFVGKMDEIRVWNKPRTGAEILANYDKCLAGNEANLVAYYRANESSGLVLKNAVSNPALDGVLDPTVMWNNTLNAPLTNNCSTPITSTINVSICRGEIYEGQTTSGTYINTFPASNGCDSIRTLNLTVLSNIDSVRYTNTATSCLAFDFFGQAFTNTVGIQTWQWYFGDGGTANTQNTSHTYLTASTYTVKLVVTDINGCKDSVFRDVVTGGFAVNASADTSFCSNTFVTRNLQATIGATIYSWTPSIPLNNATIPNPTATVNATTKFYVTATNTLGCVSIDSVTIFVNALPIVNTLKDTNVCRNATLVLTTTAGLTTYLWSPGIYVSDSTSANPIFINNNSRRLYVTGTNANGCSASDTIDITVLPLPPVKTLDDTLICSTNPILLTTTGAATYSWFPINNLSNPTIFNPLFNGNQDATYYVTGTGSNGCKAVDTLNIYVNIPTAFNTPPNKLMCQQQSVMLDGANGLRVNYTWSPATFLTSTSIINPIANPPSTTPYSVVVNDKACNLTQSFTVTVTVLLKPFVVATKLNDIDCAFKNAQLQVSGATDYVWSPSNGLNSTIINNPTASIPQKYYVTGTTGNGCFNRDSVEVFNNKAISLGRYIPNAFTPNGDNINDCLQLKNWMYVEILQFSIFNRWGERVFFTTNINRCWDGTYKGKKAEAGNYIIIVKAKTKCGIEEQKANVLLIR